MKCSKPIGTSITMNYIPLSCNHDPFANRFMNIKLQKAMPHTPNYKTELVTYPKNPENTELHDP
jgi:hypothetical protein